MNLEENVNKIKEKIQDSYHKRLVRLGIRHDDFKPRDEENEDYKKAKATINALLEDTHDFAEARAEYLEEVTFTLFNRIAGIKVMESESRQLVPEIIQIRAQHGDRSFAHNVWTEENPDKSSETLEGLESFIRDKFDELNNDLPLYSRNYPFDLMPEVHDLKDIINLFNDEISLDDWEKDDILGWLYESYNKKDYKEFKDSGDKIEWDKLSLSSQMYTPRWVVKFLVNNSLGKYWLEINPTSRIKDNHDIANAPEDPVLDKKKVEDIKMIDPAVGSGNFLLYAFDLLTEIYEEEGYKKEEIPSLIIANNLYGLDIDERAVQIARLQIYIKAKTYNRNSTITDINIVSSNFHLPEFKKVQEEFSMNIDFIPNERDFLKELWNELRQAHKFGSLLTLDESLSRFFADRKENDNLGLFDSISNVDNLEVVVLNKLKEVFSKTLENAYSTNFIKHQSLDAIKFAEIMLGVNKENSGYKVEKYDIAVANPPYTDSADYGQELKNYISYKYKEPISFYKNLYACFLKKNSDFTNDQGKIAMIHPLTFMYIKSFEDMREFILNNYHINILVEFGLGGVFEDNKINVDTVGYILENNNYYNPSFFMNLQEYKGHSNKGLIFNEAYKDYISKKDNKHNFILNQDKLKIIDGYPFIYWISDSFRENFKKKKMGDKFIGKKGLDTGYNYRFLRFWWEVDKDKISDNYQKDNKKWVSYLKGGPSNKWYGNDWLVVNWGEGQNIMKNYRGSRIQNTDYYFEPGVTFGRTSSKDPSFRIKSENNIFSGVSPTLFSNEKDMLYILLSFYNSKLFSYILSSLNNTVETQIGDVLKVPYIEPSVDIQKFLIDLTKKNIMQKKIQYKYEIIEKEYKSNPLNDNTHLNIERKLKKYIISKFESNCQILLNEYIINEVIFNVYGLTENDRKMVLEQEGLPEGLFPVLLQDKESFLENNSSDLEDKVIDFINDLPIETKRSRTNLSDDAKKLYKKSMSLIEISKDLKLNPISVVEMIKEFNFYPKKLAYEKAHEFLLDMTREILTGNDDGIVLVNEYAGEKPLDEMIETKLYVKGFSSGDIKRLEKMLGKKIKQYLLSNFFSDECDTLNLFRFLPKTPFIWHLTSGENHGFDVYTIIYRWNRDKLLKIKSYYIDKRRAGLNNRLSNLANDNSASTEKEKDQLRKQLNEVKVFEDKLDQLLSSGYDPELDDGVGKNIAPLQELGLLADDVLTKSQLKKFLNADW